MKLSKRLNQIIKFLEKSDCIADVGCDHGKVLYYINKYQVADKVIASDISLSSLLKAKELLENNGYLQNQYFVSSGFESYTDYAKEEMDGFIISGMGGYEICNILEYLISEKNKFKNLKYFVLQPQNNTPIVRKLLLKNKFYITDDVLVFDAGKYYNVLKVSAKKPKQRKRYNKLSLKYGYDNLVAYNEDFYEYLKSLKVKTENIIKNAKNKKKFLREMREINKILGNCPYNISCDT